METPLRTKRVERDWTQIRLARIAGVNPSTVAKAERGIRISPLAQGRIARALEAERFDLFPISEESAS
jgi:transcriptional regulator with XRE-family HTH domain